MNFKEKLRGAFYKMKAKLIVGAILVLMIITAGCAPLSIAFHDAFHSEEKDRSYGRTI